MTKLWGVQPDQLDRAWPWVEPLLAAAVERTGRYDLASLRKAIAAREFQLWAAWDDRGIRAVAVTEIVRYPVETAVRILIATGEDRRDWLKHIETIEAWAAAGGCSRIEAFARPGWERVLTGYRKTHVILEKRLCPSSAVDRANQAA